MMGMGESVDISNGIVGEFQPLAMPADRVDSVADLYKIYPNLNYSFSSCSKIDLPEMATIH